MYNHHKHSRQSIRLKNHDYSEDGFYFVTIFTQNREFLLGEIIEDKMHLNELGKIVENHWKQIPTKYPNVSLDEFAIMPNHLHGIIVIDSVGATLAVAQKFN